MSALVGWILRVLVILSLFSMPLSMSHASKMSTDESHSSHMGVVGVQHSTTSHDHSANTNDPIEHDVDGDGGHHGDNCCSSICGGDIVVDNGSHSSKIQVSRFAAQHEKPHASGEWVTPHRPPSI